MCPMISDRRIRALMEGAAKADFRRVDRSGRSRESQARAKGRFAQMLKPAATEEATREPVARADDLTARRNETNVSATAAPGRSCTSWHALMRAQCAR